MRWHACGTSSRRCGRRQEALSIPSEIRNRRREAVPIRTEVHRSHYLAKARSAKESGAKESAWRQRKCLSFRRNPEDAPSGLRFSIARRLPERRPRTWRTLPRKPCVWLSSPRDRAAPETSFPEADESHGFGATLRRLQAAHARSWRARSRQCSRSLQPTRPPAADNSPL
jgi:hypothetical protein